MFRPHNETRADLARESAIAATFGAALGFRSWEKLSPNLYGIDFAAFDAGTDVCAWFEIKARRNVEPDSRVQIVSLAKALTLHRWAQATDRPAYFVVNVPGRGVLSHRILAPRSYPIRRAGNPRGQPGDFEPCCVISLDAFSLIAPPLVFQH